MGFLSGLGFSGMYTLTSSILGVASSRYSHSLDKLINEHNQFIRRLDARIRGEQLIRSVRMKSAQVAHEAAALLSVSAIDVGSGSAAGLVEQSLIEADREVERIMRTTI